MKNMKSNLKIFVSKFKGNDRPTYLPTCLYLIHSLQFYLLSLTFPSLKATHTPCYVIWNALLQTHSTRRQCESNIGKQFFSKENFSEAFRTLGPSRFVILLCHSATPNHRFNHSFLVRGSTHIGLFCGQASTYKGPLVSIAHIHRVTSAILYILCIIEHVFQYSLLLTTVIVNYGFKNYDSRNFL